MLKWNGYKYSFINKFGYCCYSFEKDIKGKYVHIYNLFVYPKFRMTGKAREILLNVINAIREKGYNGTIKIVANSKEKNINIKKLTLFYKSLDLEVFSCYS